ncbi:hypothetical protein ACHAXM_010092 [Skeletonema potamos]
MTFNAPDGKSFTVRQLASAIAKVRRRLKTTSQMMGMMGGGWYSEGLRPQEEVKEPHTFASH